MAEREGADRYKTVNENLDITNVFRRHAKAVYRLAFSYLGSAADAEDATQNVFMKLINAPRAFENEEHEKAWLLACTSNLCKDVLKSAHRRHRGDMPLDVPDPKTYDPYEFDDVTRAVLNLPERYKDCVYLHYYEGYKTHEIAAMTGAPPSTVRNRLRDARAILEKSLRKQERRNDEAR